MQNCLGGIGLKVTWINGIDTRGEEQGSGVIGCYKSHLLAYSRLLQSGTECCLILEDDAVLDSKSAGYFEVIGRAAREIDLLFLADEHPHKPNLPISPLGPARQVCLKRFASTGGYAYTINRRAAENILRNHPKAKIQIDVLLHSWWRTGLLTAYVIPPLAGHGPDESLIGKRGRVHHRIDHKVRRRLLFERQQRRVRKACSKALFPTFV